MTRGSAAPDADGPVTPIGEVGRRARFACPRCHAGIERIQDDANGLPLLECTACKSRFPVIRGVPRLAMDLAGMEEVARSFGFQWQEQSKGTFEDRTIYGETEEEELSSFFDRFGLQRVPGVSGLAILDAGCGSGRLTTSLGRSGASLVVGLDISESVDVAADRSRSLPNVQIVQGNILHPPLRECQFDLIWSEGVLHHTPDARKAFQSLVPLLRPGGRMYVWLYPPSFNAYRLMRDLLPFSWRLHARVLLSLCYFLAIPLWFAATLRRWIGRGSARTFREIAFGLHDNLSPRYQSRHTNEELAGWFEACGMKAVRPVGPATGVMGTAPTDHPSHASA